MLYLWNPGAQGLEARIWSWPAVSWTIILRPSTVVSDCPWSGARAGSGLYVCINAIGFPLTKSAVTVDGDPDLTMPVKEYRPSCGCASLLYLNR